MLDGILDHQDARTGLSDRPRPVPPALVGLEKKICPGTQFEPPKVIRRWREKPGITLMAYANCHSSSTTRVTGV
jgi:hypothetical protein